MHLDAEVGDLVAELQRVVLAGEDRLAEVLADLLDVDVEGGGELDVADVVAAEVDVHQARHLLGRVGVLVVLDALHERAGAVADADDRDADLLVLVTRGAVGRAVGGAHVRYVPFSEVAGPLRGGRASPHVCPSPDSVTPICTPIGFHPVPPSQPHATGTSKPIRFSPCRSRSAGARRRARGPRPPGRGVGERHLRCGAVVEQGQAPADALGAARAGLPRQVPRAASTNRCLCSTTIARCPDGRDRGARPPR